MSIDNLFSELVTEAYKKHPFYAEKFSGLVSNKGLNKFTKFEDLPLTYPIEIIENKDKFIVDGSVYRYSSSSGTSGYPKLFPKTKSDTENSVKAMVKLLTACGVREYDVICIGQPFDMSHIGYITLEASKYLGAISVPVGLSLDESALDSMIRITNSSILFSSPSKVRVLYKTKDEVPPKLRLIILAGERIEQHEMEKLSDDLDLAVCSLYGSEDTDGLGYSCQECKGYHLLNEYFHFEVVDPDSLQPCDLQGMAVITSKYANGIPLIRYALGDIYKPVPNLCGKDGMTVQILGRADHYIELFDGVKLFGYQLSVLGESICGLGNDFQFAYRKFNHETQIELRIESTALIPVKEAIRMLENCCPDVSLIVQKYLVKFSITENRQIIYTKRGKRNLIIKLEKQNDQ